MGRIVATFFTTADGVVQDPQNWHFPYFDEEMGRIMSEGQQAQRTYLLGRGLYEEWAAYWPEHLEVDDFGPYIHALPKYLLTSRPVEGEPWNNTTVITEDHATAVRALKDATEGDIGMSGCATTVRWLLTEGLLDELNLFVDPVVVGKGRRWFDDLGTVPLTLTHSEALPTGVLHLRYAPT